MVSFKGRYKKKTKRVKQSYFRNEEKSVGGQGPGVEEKGRRGRARCWPHRGRLKPTQKHGHCSRAREVL